MQDRTAHEIVGGEKVALNQVKKILLQTFETISAISGILLRLVVMGIVNLTFITVSSASRTWLSGAASQWILENADLSVGEVEDFLADVIATDVGDGLSIEDGSLQEVAANIMRFYHMASEKEVAAAVEAMPKPVGAAQCQGQEQQGGQDQGMEMDSEQQQEAPPRREKQEPEVDEDGFVTVTKKGGRR